MVLLHAASHPTSSCSQLTNRQSGGQHHMFRSSSLCLSSQRQCRADAMRPHNHTSTQQQQIQHARSLVVVNAGQVAEQTGNMQGSVDPDYLAAASYLSEVGFTNKTEIARVLDIAMNPNSMFVAVSVNANARPLTVEADMQPVVQFLRSRGVSVGDTVKVISAHPPVLSYSVEGRLVPFWDYLTSIGVTDVAAAVAKRPTILGLSVEASLRKIVEYLQYIETPPEKIVDYICNTI